MGKKRKTGIQKTRQVNVRVNEYILKKAHDIETNDKTTTDIIKSALITHIKKLRKKKKRDLP